MWLILHSLFMTGAGIALLAGASVSIVARIVVAESAIAFAMLLVEGGVAVRRPANAITAIRLAIALAALVSEAIPVVPGPLWKPVLFGLLVIGEGSDLVDGVVARRSGPSPFGARLDMETDAFFMLTLAIVATSEGFPRWIVIAGLLRYVVAIPFFLLPPRRFPRVFSLSAKSACAAAAVALLVVLFPVAGPGLRLAAAATAVSLLTASFVWEGALRVGRALERRRAGIRTGRVAWGLARSFLTYYGIPFRLSRMKRFYRQFVGQGDLVLDIGAHLGNRIRAFRSLGADVIAVEPQRSCVEILERLYGDDPHVSVRHAACGAQPGTATLRVPPDHPTLATLSDDWITNITTHYASLGIQWADAEQVEVCTLDSLIEGQLPALVKIDVEGFETQTLLGLTRPVPAISFEFLPASLDSALSALDAVRQLGSYTFNYSMVESMRFALDSWISGDELETILAQMEPTGPSGDIYARLEEGPG